MTNQQNYSISKKFKFECAHKLNRLPDGHPCGCLHGHSYKVEIILYSTQLNEHGFIIDFGNLKMFQHWLDEKFDHALILSNDEVMNDFILSQKHFKMPYSNTSAENMCHYFSIKFCELLKKPLSQNNHIYKIKVKVWETENNYASFEINI